LTDSPNQSAKREAGEPLSSWQERQRRIRRETVIDVLESFGITVDDINEVQADFQFLRKQRKMTEQVASKVRLGFIGLLFALITWGATYLLSIFGPQAK